MKTFAITSDRHDNGMELYKAESMEEAMESFFRHRSMDGDEMKHNPRCWELTGEGVEFERTFSVRRVKP